MAFAGDVRAWLTSLLSCINSIVHNGKNLVCSKIDGTTVTVSRPVHHYTIAANANKAWWRIAQSNVGQLTPMHCEFVLRAKNAGSKDNYQIWHCFVEVYGNASGVHILGGPNLPFSQLRILYENTVANVTDEKLSYIDLYCNQKNSSATEFEIEEIYNDGIIFVADGAPSASSIPSGYENRAVGANQSGIYYSSQSDTSNYSRIQYTAITADATLAANWSYRMRVLNCTQPVTLTVNQTGAGSDCYHWVKNSSSGVVTIHPATSSIFFDDVSADITLQPGEFLKFHCQSTGHYVILEDGRWKSKKLDAGSSNYVKSLTISGKTITVTKGDDTTATLTTQDTTYSEATQNSAGLMSAQDKTNLDTMAAGSIYVHPTYTARTGKPTADATPGFGDTVTVSQITSDTTGHVTAATDRTITIPATEATSSAAGLMSATDKAALAAVQDTYVKKTGDTITGGLAAVGDMNAIKHSDSEHELRICGGRSLTDGGTLVLFGKDDTNTGGFRLYTTDANGVSQFILAGYPSGRLQWGSNSLGHQLIECVKSSSNNSYIRYKSGLQICMGTFSISSSAPEDGKEVTFPIPFSAEPKIMISRRLTSANYNDVWSPVVYPRSATGFTVRVRWASTSGTYGYSSGNFAYTAIGYFSE